MEQKIDLGHTTFRWLYTLTRLNAKKEEKLLSALKTSPDLNPLTNASHNDLWNPFFVFSMHVYTWLVRAGGQLLIGPL